MEIKVTFQGNEVWFVDFDIYTVMKLMRRLGYTSFHVRSKVAKYEPFATFKNEDTDEYISFFPDKGCMKANDCKISFEELRSINDILLFDFAIKYNSNVEECE